MGGSHEFFLNTIGDSQVVYLYPFFQVLKNHVIKNYKEFSNYYEIDNKTFERIKNFFESINCFEINNGRMQIPYIFDNNEVLNLQTKLKTYYSEYFIEESLFKINILYYFNQNKDNFSEWLRFAFFNLIFEYHVASDFVTFSIPEQNDVYYSKITQILNDMFKFRLKKEKKKNNSEDMSLTKNKFSTLMRLYEYFGLSLKIDSKDYIFTIDPEIFHILFNVMKLKEKEFTTQGIDIANFFKIFSKYFPFNQKWIEEDKKVPLVYSFNLFKLYRNNDLKFEYRSDYPKIKLDLNYDLKKVGFDQNYNYILF